MYTGVTTSSILSNAGKIHRHQFARLYVFLTLPE